MKTLKALNKIQEELEDKLVKGEASEKSLKPHFERMRKAKLALEQGAKKKYLMKDLDETIIKLETAEKNYDLWIRNTPGLENVKNPKALYNKESGINKMKKQIIFLEYMLS